LNNPNQILRAIFVALLCALGFGLGACQKKDTVNERSPSSQVSATSAQETASQKPVSPSVTLTWKASASVGKPSPDPVIGYNVYRGTRPQQYEPKPLNSTPVEVPSYVDMTVERGKTYYYVTRTVTAQGVVSRPSNEVAAAIPPQ